MRWKACAVEGLWSSLALLDDDASPWENASERALGASMLAGRLERALYCAALPVL